MPELPTDVELDSGALVFGRPHPDSTLPKTPPTRKVPTTVPKLTAETVTIPYIHKSHSIIAKPALRASYLVADHELGGDASGYVSIDLDQHDGEGSSALFTTQTREATDGLINALVRARNSAYPDAGSLSTSVSVPIASAAESPDTDADLEPPNIAAESPYAAWRGRHGIDGSVMTDDEPPLSERWFGFGEVFADEDAEPTDQPQSEQPRREAALRRVIERELGRMDQEGV